MAPVILRFLEHTILLKQPLSASTDHSNGQNGFSAGLEGLKVRLWHGFINRFHPATINKPTNFDILEFREDLNCLMRFHNGRFSELESEGVIRRIFSDIQLAVYNTAWLTLLWGKWTLGLGVVAVVVCLVSVVSARLSEFVLLPLLECILHKCDLTWPFVPVCTTSTLKLRGKCFQYNSLLHACWLERLKGFICSFNE